MRVGVYPGSFNPPTLAHLAIAAAARAAGGLDVVDMVMSEQALGKAAPVVPTLADRLAVLASVVSRYDWLRATTTSKQFLADIAEGYDALVLGEDKWAQVWDSAWYGSEQARDDAVRRLPPVLLAPRPSGRLVAGPDAATPPAVPGMVVLELDPAYGEVSSTGARAGRREWMAEEAARWDDAHRAWSNPDAYLAGQAGTGSPKRRVPGCPAH